jgi:hypothetical protein
MERKVPKNKSEQLRKGKKTLFKKAHKLAKVHDIDIAVIMHKNGQYVTYRSKNHESWPPTMKQIVSRNSCPDFYNRFNVTKQASYPLPKNLLPHDMEVPPQLGPAPN